MMFIRLQPNQQQSWILVQFVVCFCCYISYSNHSNSIQSSCIVVDAASRPIIWSQIRHRIPFLKGKHHDDTTTYTPLIFFTVPKGLIPVNDEMEQIVSQIELECQVKVQRLDVLRHPENEAVLTMVTNSIRTASPTPTTITTTSSVSNSASMIQPQPPLLYHRESRQVFQVLTTPTSSSSATSKVSSTATTVTPYVDKELIRAWAKGRYLSPFIGGSRTTTTMQYDTKSNIKSPVVVNNNNVEEDDMDNNSNIELLLDEMALSPEQLKGKRLMEERTRAKTTTTK